MSKRSPTSSTSCVFVIGIPSSCQPQVDNSAVKEFFDAVAGPVDSINRKGNVMCVTFCDENTAVELLRRKRRLKFTTGGRSLLIGLSATEPAIWPNSFEGPTAIVRSPGASSRPESLTTAIPDLGLSKSSVVSSLPAKAGGSNTGCTGVSGSKVSDLPRVNVVPERYVLVRGIPLDLPLNDLKSLEPFKWSESIGRLTLYDVKNKINQKPVRTEPGIVLPVCKSARKILLDNFAAMHVKTRSHQFRMVFSSGDTRRSFPPGYGEYAKGRLHECPFCTTPLKLSGNKHVECSGDICLHSIRIKDPIVRLYAAAYGEKVVGEYVRTTFAIFGKIEEMCFLPDGTLVITFDSSLSVESILLQPRRDSSGAGFGQGSIQMRNESGQQWCRLDVTACPAGLACGRASSSTDRVKGQPPGGNSPPIKVEGSGAGVVCPTVSDISLIRTVPKRYLLVSGVPLDFPLADLKSLEPFKWSETIDPLFLFMKRNTPVIVLPVCRPGRLSLCGSTIVMKTPSRQFQMVFYGAGRASKGWGSVGPANCVPPGYGDSNGKRGIHKCPHCTTAGELADPSSLSARGSVPAGNAPTPAGGGIHPAPPVRRVQGSVAGVICPTVSNLSLIRTVPKRYLLVGGVPLDLPLADLKSLEPFKWSETIDPLFLFMKGNTPVIVLPVCRPGWLSLCGSTTCMKTPSHQFQMVFSGPGMASRGSVEPANRVPHGYGDSNGKRGIHKCPLCLTARALPGSNHELCSGGTCRYSIKIKDFTRFQVRCPEAETIARSSFAIFGKLDEMRILSDGALIITFESTQAVKNVLLQPGSCVRKGTRTYRLSVAACPVELACGRTRSDQNVPTPIPPDRSVQAASASTRASVPASNAPTRAGGGIPPAPPLRLSSVPQRKRKAEPDGSLECSCSHKAGRSGSPPSLRKRATKSPPSIRKRPTKVIKTEVIDVEVESLLIDLNDSAAKLKDRLSQIKSTRPNFISRSDPEPERSVDHTKSRSHSVFSSKRSGSVDRDKLANESIELDQTIRKLSENLRRPDLTIQIIMNSHSAAISYQEKQLQRLREQNAAVSNKLAKTNGNVEKTVQMLEKLSADPADIVTIRNAERAEICTRLATLLAPWHNRRGFWSKLHWQTDARSLRNISNVITTSLSGFAAKYVAEKAYDPVADLTALIANVLEMETELKKNSQ